MVVLSKYRFKSIWKSLHLSWKEKVSKHRLRLDLAPLWPSNASIEPVLGWLNKTFFKHLHSFTIKYTYQTSPVDLFDSILVYRMTLVRYFSFCLIWDEEKKKVHAASYIQKWQNIVTYHRKSSGMITIWLSTNLLSSVSCYATANLANLHIRAVSVARTQHVNLNSAGEIVQHSSQC